MPNYFNKLKKLKINVPNNLIYEVIEKTPLNFNIINESLSFLNSIHEIFFCLNNNIKSISSSYYKSKKMIKCQILKQNVKMIIIL